MEAESTKPGVFQRVCKNCGKNFTTIHKRQEHCSLKCRLAWKKNRRQARVDAAKTPRKCPLCGKEFMPDMKHRRFCSADCQGRHTEVVTKVVRARQVRERQRNKTVEYRPHECKWCGKQFQRVKGLRTEYCSPECKASATAESASATRMRKAMGVTLEPHVAQPRPKSTYKGTRRPCAYCGEYFTCSSRRNRFCSVEHRVLYIRGEQKRRYHEQSLALEYSNPEKPSNVCIVCGKPLQEGYRSQCCSPRCTDVYINRLITQAVDTASQERSRVCPECGKKFIPGIDTRANKVYCSKQCQSTATSRNMYRKFKEKLQNMTPDEQHEFRAKLAARNREYRHRREKEFYERNFDEG